jgi:hypothetical protein
MPEDWLDNQFNLNLVDDNEAVSEQFVQRLVLQNRET